MTHVVFGIILFVAAIPYVENSHFRGGTTTWRPLNTTPSGSTVDIIIRQRYSWNRAVYFCDDTTIASLGAIGDYSAVYCVTGSCSSWNLIYTQTYCTDYSIDGSVSSGEMYDTITIPLNTVFSIAFESGAWFGNLVVGANGGWSLVTLVNTIVRPDGSLNTSPVATTLPVIYKAINVQHVHLVQMSDFDSSDTLRCRWSIGSTSNVNSYDECSSVCSGVPGAVLYTNNCTLVFTLTMSSMYVAVALQIEDYYTSSSSTPMSSVPLQFLFYGYTTPSGCSTPPAIIGNRPDRACIGIPVGSTVTEYVIVEVYCNGKSIVDFITSSPVGLTKSAITKISKGFYQIILSWVPTADQVGPQAFCAGAIDDTNVQSNQWCITFLVGYNSPNLIRPSTVQGTASPMGTIFANHTIFSIQATNTVNRPSRNSTYVYFNNAATNTSVYTMDCGYDSHVVYNGQTIIFYIPSPPWIPGQSYYITFDSGVASGTEFCKPESSPITDRTFWTFDIWDSAVSSTTTTTTTPPTTGTVTTRFISSTSVNTLLTTTGISITNITTLPTVTTTTTTSMSTSTTSTTVGSLNATTIPMNNTDPPMQLINPKDLENACASPVAIITALSMLILLPVHGISLFVFFVKFANTINPLVQQATKRNQMRVKRFDED